MQFTGMDLGNLNIAEGLKKHCCDLNQIVRSWCPLNIVQIADKITKRTIFFDMAAVEDNHLMVVYLKTIYNNNFVLLLLGDIFSLLAYYYNVETNKLFELEIKSVL